MALAHGVDWDPDFARRSEWLWPIATAAAELRACRDFPTHAELDAMYAARARTRGGTALSFRPDANAGKRRAPTEPALRYDGLITLSAEVPTRARNWHDLLNALCFATFPEAKRALHARQYRAQCRGSVQVSARGEERDTLTLFDEGGVAVVTGAEDANVLRAALAGADYAQLRALERARRALFVPFGHALFEHMVEGLPCPGASARVLVLEAPPPAREPLLAAVDRALADELARETRFVRRAEAEHVRLEWLRAREDRDLGSKLVL